MSTKPSFQDRLRSRPLRDLHAGSEGLWAYRDAAAVLATFDFQELQPFQSAPSTEARAQLLADCDVTTSGPASTLWTLRTPIRKASLRRLFDLRALNDALQVNPSRIMTDTQRVFERCINLDSSPSFSPSSAIEAAALLEVSYWLQDIHELSSRLPRRDTLRALIGREQLLEPFRTLVGDHFAGRRQELNTLADYVGILSASSFTESAYRFIERIFNIIERPPLFVLGPGGCGKSTLIAKFVLEHAAEQENAQFPFAYLDFDRPALTAGEPVTLLAEAMHQLADQYPGSKLTCTDILERWVARIEAQVNENAGPDDGAVDGPVSLVNQELNLKQRSLYLDEFAVFTRELENGREDKPLLLILDTFEEVQFRSAALEDAVFDFLNSVQQRIPRLRTVLCGRTAITSTRYKVKTLAIGNFDRDTAVVFLSHYGIVSQAVAGTVVDQVGTSPLVLRLAAELVKTENVGVGGIQDLGSKWLAMFRRERIEVVLYKRILSHVRDKRVEQLAYPGLVLRYITPQILLTVLAPACNVPIRDEADALEVLNLMRQQLCTLLVSSGTNDKLIHRTDMRKILIEDLAQRSATESSIKSLLQTIHLKIIDFYARTDDAESRAEEIFHRLALDQDRDLIKGRWRDGLAPYLGSAIQELPPGAQSFLAARLGLEVPEEVWRNAVDEDWALHAIRRSNEFLRLDKPKEALDLLRQRKRLWSDVSLLNQAYKAVDALLIGAARTYEKTRREQDSGNKRTRDMENVVADVLTLADEVSIAPDYIETTFARNQAGDRIVALALARAHPHPASFDLAIAAIGSALSPFEQYCGLMLATSFKPIPIEKQAALREALLKPKGTPFHSTDSSRLKLRDRLLSQVPDRPLSQVTYVKTSKIPHQELRPMNQNVQPPPAPPSRYPESMRAIFAAFAHHGKPLRGLMSTAKSSSFQGRFGRMFRSLPAATYGATDAQSRAALMTLGAAMTSSFDAPKDGFDGEESGIPALYTYFGQFIDHDITFDPMTTLIQRSDPDALTDFRTPALDLDNVYGRGPSDQPYMYDNSGLKFLLGTALGNGAPDLARNHANPARAIIGDPRNDENSIVSQFQALMLRFHNRVVDDNPGLDFPSLQKIVRWHYQWVVVNDFLPRIVSAPVLDALKTNGQYAKKNLEFFHWKNDPFMPIEFSVAAYRLGHSMIRPGYRMNDDDSTLLPIFPIPPNTIEGIPAGIPDGLTGFQAMATNRGIDWGRFIDLAGDVRSYGDDPDKVNPPNAAMKKRLQFAYRIDTSVVTPLSVLPTAVASDPPPSLPQRNLLRGFELGLPTGQSVARAMGVTPLKDEEIIIGKAVDSPSGDDVLGKLADLPQLSAFRGNCPLWTYILAEAAMTRTAAAIPVQPAMKINTPQLGPVGGRIVAEVFLGMLFGDNDSFLSADPEWVPTIGKAGKNFALRDIVAYSLGG